MLSNGKWISAIALLCFTSTIASAQVARTPASNGALISTTQPRASMLIPDANPKTEGALPAGATVIYSNLGTGASAYNPGIGWTEAGAVANDYPIAEAMAFTPASDFILLRIDAAIQYVQGTNGMKLLLAEDNGGIPGQVFYVATFTNLPTFGTCCTVQTAKLSPTKTSYIALKGGQRYWLYPLPADATSYLVWNYDTTSLGGYGALSENYGQTWTSTSYATFGAFDLYGIPLTE